MHYHFIPCGFLSATAQGDAAFPWRRRRKRAWRGFVFMTPHFFAGKAQRTNCQAISLQARMRASQQRRERKRIWNRENSRIKRKPFSLKLSFLQKLKWQLHMIDSLGSFVIFFFYWGFFLESSLYFCASIIIFLNRRSCAAYYCDA